MGIGRSYLPAYCRNLSLRHHIERDDICKTASFHVLHHDPQVQSMQVAVQEIDNVLVLAVFHDQNLIDNQILLRLQIQIHLLDGDASIGVILIRSEHASRCSLTDLVEVVVFLRGVTGSTNRLQLGSHIKSIALTSARSRAGGRSGQLVRRRLGYCG